MATGHKPVEKSLGLGMLIALVVGNMIGSGVFLLPAALAKFGSISLLGWLFTAIGAILLALVFARLSRVMPATGGPYAFCREAFGDFVGFQAAYCYWIYAWVGNAAITVGFAGYIGYFFPLVASDTGVRLMVMLVAIWSLTGLSIISMKLAGRVQVLLTLIKVLPLLLIGIVGLFYIEPAHFTPFNISGMSDSKAIMSAAALTLWAFIGMESATIPAGSAKNASKNIPKATVIGVFVVAFIYLLGSFAIMGVMSNEALQHSHAPYADAADKIFGGSVGGPLVAFGAVASTLGALNGWIMVQAQVPMAAAQDKLFPAIFGKTTRKGVPAFGLIISSVLITILLIMSQTQDLVEQFSFIILLATMVVMIPYVFTTLGEIILFCKYPEKFSGLNFGKAALMAALAFLYVMWAIMGAGQEVVYYGILLLLFGTPFYVAVKIADIFVKR